jgi:hypothetical protein
MPDKPVSTTPTPRDPSGHVDSNRNERRAAVNPDPGQAQQQRENARPAQEQRRWQEQDR